MEQKKVFNADFIELEKLKFKEQATYLLLSARRTGKTVLIKHLIYLLLKRKLIDYIYCISYTADIDKNYTSWLAPEYIVHPKDMDAFIDLTYKIQKATPETKRRNVCIIFDDFDITAKSPSIDMLFARGRHYGITSILSAQLSTSSVSPLIRSNVQYLFVRQLNEEALAKNVYPILLNSPFRKSIDFVDFVIDNNQDFQFIVYLNDGRERNETVKITKANDNIKFKFTYTKPKKEKEKKPN